MGEIVLSISPTSQADDLIRQSVLVSEILLVPISYHVVGHPTAAQSRRSGDGIKGGYLSKCTYVSIRRDVPRCLFDGHPNHYDQVDRTLLLETWALSFEHIGRNLTEIGWELTFAPQRRRDP